MHSYLDSIIKWLNPLHQGLDLVGIQKSLFKSSGKCCWYRHHRRVGYRKEAHRLRRRMPTNQRPYCAPFMQWSPGLRIQACRAKLLHLIKFTLQNQNRWVVSVPFCPAARFQASSHGRLRAINRGGIRERQIVLPDRSASFLYRISQPSSNGRTVRLQVQILKQRRYAVGPKMHQSIWLYMRF